MKSSVFISISLKVMSLVKFKKSVEKFLEGSTIATLNTKMASMVILYVLKFQGGIYCLRQSH